MLDGVQRNLIVIKLLIQHHSKVLSLLGANNGVEFIWFGTCNSLRAGNTNFNDLTTFNVIHQDAKTRSTRLILQCWAMLNRNAEFVWPSRSISYGKVVFMNPLDRGLIKLLPCRFSCPRCALCVGFDEFTVHQGKDGRKLRSHFFLAPSQKALRALTAFPSSNEE